jgi:hypothetical protein
LSGYGEIQIFGIRLKTFVQSGADYTQQISMLVVNRTTAIAGADGCGNLSVLLPSRTQCQC